MIKITSFAQGAKRPNEFDELHNLIEMCFEEDDSFSMVFTQETLEDTKAEIARYCASKGIQVDQAYIDGTLYVEKILPEPIEADQPLSDMSTFNPSQNGNGSHKRTVKQFKKRFAHIVKEVIEQLPLNGQHELFVKHDEPKYLADAFYNFTYRHPEMNITIKCRQVKNGIYVRKITKGKE